MPFFPYVDSKRKAESIAIKFDIGKTNKQISEELNISPTSVSYYLKKQGRSRPRLPSKSKANICVVCRERPVSSTCPNVCSHADCIAVFLSTLECEKQITAVVNGKVVPVDQETKIAFDIQRKAGFKIPPEAQVCVWNNVTRLLGSVADHIRFHACQQYYYKKPRRPPIILWTNEDELRLFKIRQKEVEYTRRNRYSESPQPRRMRFAR